MIGLHMLRAVRVAVFTARAWTRLILGRCDRCGGDVYTTGEVKRTCGKCGAHVW